MKSGTGETTSMPKPKSLQKVEVQWEDICSHDGWIPPEYAARSCTTILCHSVGYLFAEDKQVIKLASTYNSEHLGHVLVIPKAVVKKITKLR